MLSNSAAIIIAAGIVIGAAVLSPSSSTASPPESPGPIVQPLGNGHVFVLYMNTMLSCDANGCQRIGHMFDANLSAPPKK